MQHARSYALEAERKMGEILAATAREKSRQTQGGDRKSKCTGSILIPDLAALGLSKKASSCWQAVARIPTLVFEAWGLELEAEDFRLTGFVKQFNVEAWT